MYLWKIHLLRTELERGSLAEREQFKYFIALAALWSAAEAFPTPQNDLPAAPEDPFTIVIVSAGYVTATLGLLFHCYRQNGGASGHDFLGRFVSLFWVTTIQIAVVAYLPLAILFYGVDPALIPLGVVVAATFAFAALPLVQVLMVARHLRILSVRTTREIVSRQKKSDIRVT
jgi:hypothetical protein